MPKIHVAQRDPRVALPKANFKFSVQTKPSKHKPQPERSAPSQYLPFFTSQIFTLPPSYLLEGQAGTRTFRVINLVSPFCASTAIVNQEYADTSGCLMDRGKAVDP